MARKIASRLETGGETTTLYTERASTTSNPSGTTGTGTIPTCGAEWVDLWLTVATDACEIKIWAYGAGAWHVDTAFGTAGVYSSATGSYRLSHQCLGADYVHVQVTDVGTGGTITVKTTLSQGSFA